MARLVEVVRFKRYEDRAIGLEIPMMLRKITHGALACSLLLLVTAAALPSPQEKAEKVPKDQQEYELINKTFKEANPATKLQLLDQWKEKYPTTAFDEERIRLYMASYQATNQGPKAVATAKEILKKINGDFSANFTIASLTPFLGKSDAATYDDGVNAAKALLGGGIDKQFASANKPATVSQKQWDDGKKQAQTSAHQTLGWVAMQRKQNEGAEKEFTEVLKLNPASAQVSYWLAQVVLAQAKPDKNSLAIFSFARAATYDGPGALAPEGRQKVDEYLTQLYTKFAGTEDGLAALKSQAKASAFPSAGLEIKSAGVRKFEYEKKMRAEHPLRYVFIDLKLNLLGSNGDALWGDLNGKLTPEMRLIVVGSEPPERPRTIRLTSTAGGNTEVVLNLENRLRSGLRSGSELKFEGVAGALTKEPFRLTLNDGKVVP